MRNFSSVYIDNKKKVDENLKIIADKERLDLLKAIKKEYGIKNFEGLSESEKNHYKKMIMEMWSPEAGLNERGKKLVKESKMTLTPSSTPEEIKIYVTKAIKSDIKNLFLSIFSDDENGRQLLEIKKEIEEQIEREIDDNKFKNIAYELMCNYLKEKLSIK